MKLTPWFPPEVRPVRKGVYEIDTDMFGFAYAYWQGDRWSWFASSVEELVGSGYISKDTFNYHEPRFKWRGLARKPK